MSDSSTRRKFIAATGSAAALALAGCSGEDGGSGTENGTAENMTEAGTMDEQMTETEGGDGMMEQRTVTVRIENVAPTDFYGSETPTGGAIWLTPGAYAVHSGDNPIYTAGESASVGLEALAESGHASGFEGEDGLVDELGGMGGSVAHSGTFTPGDTVEDPNDPMGEVPGAPPIAPGGAFEFDVQATPGQKLSFASMFVPSNDLFYSAGEGGIPLWPEDGEPVSGDVTASVSLLDAGTEPNAQPPGEGPDQAPAQDSFDQGDEEGGVVRPIGQVDDGHSYPAVTDTIKVTLTPHESMNDGESMDDGESMN